MTKISENVVKHVRKELKRLANAQKAVEMAAYMKTKMPFYGVQKPDRVPILRHLKSHFRPADLNEYTDTVLALWNEPHREEKYFAINYADTFQEFVVLESIPLFERLIREGAWWDFVDPVSIDLVGHVYLNQRKKLRSKIEKWSRDDDMWIRRASLICHLHHKGETDEEQLFDLCLQLAHEKEFFIQKGMGWALREYSKTEPNAVRKFVEKNKSKLSKLTYREGLKHLHRQAETM